MAEGRGEEQQAASGNAEPPRSVIVQLPHLEPRVVARDEENGLVYETFSDQSQLATVSRLVDRDLSEPYTLFTYRYFVLHWPHLTLLARAIDESGNPGEVVGCIVGKTESREARPLFGASIRGYIAMLAVDTAHRRKGIGRRLVTLVLDEMQKEVDEVVLEAEEANRGALSLYEQLGFVRLKRLPKYYLNGSDAFRLKLRFSDAGWAHKRQQVREQLRARQQQDEAGQQQD